MRKLWKHSTIAYSFSTARDHAYRKKKSKRPKLPTSIDTVDIRSYSDLTTTKDGKPYYRGKTKSGSELFCSDVQLQIAASCESLFIDGTFGTCPFPFYQVPLFCPISSKTCTKKCSKHSSPFVETTDIKEKEKDKRERSERATANLIESRKRRRRWLFYWIVVVVVLVTVLHSQP